jgi:hypothetical protein
LILRLLGHRRDKEVIKCVFCAFTQTAASSSYLKLSKTVEQFFQ